MANLMEIHGMPDDRTEEDLAYPCTRPEPPAEISPRAWACGVIGTGAAALGLLVFVLAA